MIDLYKKLDSLRGNIEAFIIIMQMIGNSRGKEKMKYLMEQVLLPIKMVQVSI